MCVNIEVILPTIETFLFLYSLRCGCILIFLWTLLRSTFCVVFICTAILEVLVGKNSPFGAWLVNEKPATDNLYVVYYAFCTLLLNETILLLFMLHLAVGVCRYKAHLLEHYLICRFITWVIEVITLFVLCLVHKLLIGYYLAILFFVILEFYSFIVAYSFYVRLQEDEKDL